ncbi:MAG: DUF4190 domain-containing protein [Ilumatobacteraceae bacterium]
MTDIPPFNPPPPPPFPPAGPPVWGGAPDAPQESPGRAFAITSLVLGCMSVLCFGPLTAIPAIVFGSISISQAKRAGQKPPGMAVAGIVLGIVFTAISALLIAINLARL